MDRYTLQCRMPRSPVERRSEIDSDSIKCLNVFSKTLITLKRYGNSRRHENKADMKMLRKSNDNDRRRENPTGDQFNDNSLSFV